MAVLIACMVIPPYALSITLGYTAVNTRHWAEGQTENRCAARARALAISSARLLGGAFVSSEPKRFLDTASTWSTAARNAASLTFDGLLKPLIFLTNCSAAARISSSVTGGSKLKSVLMFLHISVTSSCQVGTVF